LWSLRFWATSYKFRWALLAGLLTGVYAVMRPNILLFGPFMAAWMLHAAWRAGRLRRVPGGWIGLFAAFLVIAPVTVRNYVVSGEFVPVSTYFGENFLIGNGEDSDGYTSWTPYLQKLEGTGQFSVWVYSNIVHGLGKELGNEKLTDSEASRIFFQKGLDYAMAHKVRTLKLALKKAVLFWSPWEMTENKVVQCEKDHYPPIRHMPGFPLFMGLFCAGLLLVANDALRGRLMDGREPGSYAPGPGQITVLILLFILVYYASFIPFFVNARARHPIVPLMLLIGGYGLFRIAAWTLARRWLPAISGVLLVAVLVGLAGVDWVPYRPDTARWRYDRADSWITAGALDKAEAEAEIMLGLDYSYYMPFRLGHAFAAKGRHELAARLLRAALNPDPAQQPAPYREDLLFYIGAAHTAAGKTDEARAAFEEALQLNPKDARALNDLGFLKEQAGDLAGAAELYRRALDARPEFILARTNLGELLAKQGDLAGTVREYEQAAKDAPESAEILYNLARHRAAAGRTEEALAAYRKAVALNPKDVRAWNNLGLLLAQQGDSAGAEQTYRSALEKSPNYSLARANLGNLLMDAGRFDEGVAVYEEGVRLDPKNAELMNGLGWRFDQRQDADRALPWYDRALETAPGFLAARINRANLLARIGRMDAAEKDARTAAELSPQNAQPLLVLGNVCAMSGRLGEAAAQYRRALEIDPNCAPAKDNLALVTGGPAASSAAQ
jgi:tetratricopeptide (TPR) repeat protein